MRQVDHSMQQVGYTVRQGRLAEHAAGGSHDAAGGGCMGQVGPMM
jgi:hypothetical protein